MRTLNHQNVVQLKEFFYKIDDLAENDLYLNLVLEYVPDTIFNLSQKYLKHKRLIPPLHIKVKDSLNIEFSTLIQMLVIHISAS
jgi:hypothetical protein